MRKIVKDATLAQPRVALRPSVVSRPALAPRPIATLAEPASRPITIAPDDDKQLRQLRQAAERAGYEAGIKQAQADAQAALDAERSRVDRFLDEVQQARARQIDSLREQCEAFVFTALCRMLGEAACTPAAVASAVESVLQEVGQDDVVLRVHPDDAALMRVVFDGSSRAGLKIEADAGIRLGGCIAQTDVGSFDASFDTQLASLAEALAEARARRTAKANA